MDQPGINVASTVGYALFHALLIVTLCLLALGLRSGRRWLAVTGAMIGVPVRC